MATITLEQIHNDLVGLKEEVGLLKECFHEDFLDLSDKTKADIEQSRKEIEKGDFISLENI